MTFVPTEGVPPVGRRYPVRLRTLGQFSLELDTSHGLDTSHRENLHTNQDQHSQNLLQVLIALGSTGVPIARACELLWPDADDNVALRQFDTALQHLQHQLGGENRLIRQNHCLSLNTSDIWIDAEHFERAITNLRLAGTAGAPLEAALAQYTGSFLESRRDCAIWAIPMRVRLRDLFLEGAAQCINNHFANHNLEYARALADRALHLEPLGIPVWNALIVGCELTGERTAANQARRQLRALWHAETGQTAPASLIAV